MVDNINNKKDEPTLPITQETIVKLISENNLGGLESNQKFYHLNTIEMFEKISSLSSID